MSDIKIFNKDSSEFLCQGFDNFFSCENKSFPEGNKVLLGQSLAILFFCLKVVGEKFVFAKDFLFL